MLMTELSFGQPGDVKTSNAMESNIDFAHYYRLILRNLWKIILFSIIVGLLSIFYALSLNPVFYSKTTLLIESQQPNVVSFQDVYQVDTRNRSYIGTQLQILKSRSLAIRVVERLGLTTHPMEGEGEGEEEPVLEGEEFEELIKKRVVGIVMSSITITPVRNTQLVNIFASAGDAQLSADIANAFADTYIESHLEAKLEVTQKATSVTLRGSCKNIVKGSN